MREEIAAAVVFLIRLLRQNDNIPKAKIDEFSNSLSATLVEKFKNHWYKDKPAKGQGYRCIRINAAEPIDPVLEKAATDSGLEYKDLNLPSELTVWVDPHEVCCRFGESHGSFCTLASFKDGNIQNKALTINLEEMLDKQKKEQNTQVNYVTTRTNNPRKDNTGRQGGPHPPSNKPHFNNKHQHNFYYNQHQHQYPPPPLPPPNFLTPPPPPPPPPHLQHAGPGQNHGGGRSFHGGHKPHLKGNGNMNNNGSYNYNNNVNNSSNNGNFGNNGSGPGAGGPHQGRTFHPKNGDRYHWVRGRNHGNSHKTQ